MTLRSRSESPASSVLHVSDWVEGIEGDFPLNRAVAQSKETSLPPGSRAVSAESWGVSMWTNTAKLSTLGPSGEPREYFLKCSKGDSARALTEGEYESAVAVNKVVPGLVPHPISWGRYDDNGVDTCFFLGAFRDMDFSEPPDPTELMARVAQLHQNSASPNGMFGFHVPTVIGRLERTVTWETTWAASFTHQLRDVIRYDNEANEPWPEFELACDRLIEKVIPRVLGALQSEGRELKPCLIHGDVWERNVGIDKKTGDPILFDPGCTYAHNEMEFGTWRCSWAYYFNKPVYMRMYQKHIAPSPPAEEWDDRNRLYCIHSYITASAGHPGREYRKLAYNDVLYLCEKYAPLDTLPRYDPSLDVSLTGAYVPFVME
ncbi:Fructosamine kinase-domain-containing protein [Xylariaceae sp. FL0594]|nr:Fructosamine kinase-domain-containing protein [Xylariaceae sp. FL0594]